MRENQRLADLELRQQMVGRWFFMTISTFSRSRRPWCTT
jgi:ATP-binding cassette subfamily B protein